MTPNLKVVLDYVNTYFDLPVGITHCRRISGKQTYSQHSWSNAGDIYTSNKSLQDNIAVVLKDEFGNHIRNILTWRFDDAHWNHIHIDMWPKGWLTPPCKGGELRIKYKDGKVTYSEPFPLTIKEENMPLTNEDIRRIWDFPMLTAGVNAQLALNRTERGINALLLQDHTDAASIAEYLIASLDEDIASNVADELAARLVA
jgi:hypothetical protein